MDTHALISIAVFVGVYLGIALGRWPGLAIDRTGIALCGAIILLLAGGADRALLERVDVGALAVLFGLMVLSAQFAASGFYDWSAARLGASRASPAVLLGLVVAATGALSSILANDIVVFAMTPVLCQGLRKTGRDPLPYLFGLAGAANVGSAATLIGNPQNILIGEHAALDFWDYLYFAAPLSMVGLIIVYLAVLATWWRRLHRVDGAAAARPAVAEPVALDRPALIKGALAAAVLLALYMTDLPRWQGTLLVAGILLVSRRLSTREMLASVDWHLLVLFGSLFVVTGALGVTGIDRELTGFFGAHGLTFEDPLFIGTSALVGSNTVGNVPFVILVLAAVPELSGRALYGLAVLSTFAGNLLIVGSLANLIVAERSHRQGVPIRFREHLRAGLPMALATMLVALCWIVLTL